MAEAAQQTQATDRRCPTCKHVLIPFGTSFYCLRCDARFRPGDDDTLELEPKERFDFEGT